MKYIVIVAGLLVVMWFGALIVGMQRLSDAERDGWRTPTGSLRDFGRLFPLQRTTDAAERLEEIVEPLGIDLVPRSEAFRPWRDGDETMVLRSAISQLREYINAELGQPPHVPAPLPGSAKSFLEQQEEHVRRATEQLLSADPIQWTIDLSAGTGAPLPNLLGHLQLHRVLVGKALAHAGRDEAGQAWRYLEAATKLADVTLQRPELISQIIGIAQTRTIAGAMRHVSDDPPQWALRWPASDLKSGFVTALTGDAYAIATTMRGVAPNPERDRSTRRLLATARRPYDVIIAARGLTSFKSLIAELDRTTLCSGEPQLPKPTTAPWIPMPNLATAWTRLTDASIHLAGTRRMLAARSNVPEPSSACSAGWITERGPGGIRIRYTRSFTPPSSPVAPLPLDFTLPSGG